MWRLFFKLIWNALPLALLAFVGWLIYCFTLGDCPPPPPSPPTPTVTSKAVVLEAIRNVNKQIFIEHYLMVDVQYQDAPASWLDKIIRQKMIVLVRGRVPAGFDMDKVTEDDIWVSSDGRRVQLTLPPPQIFEDNVSLDLERSRILTVSDTCPDFLCPQGTLEAYQETVLPEAKRLLIQAAGENGILPQAARDGKLYYENLLRSLGFDEVRVVVSGY